ncbi:MAG TPA: hypothetical protein VMV83_06035 [Rectinemataceae bacterium]|nr:hypothetical protein [Rectinemataceae bacterium]
MGRKRISLRQIGLVLLAAIAVASTLGSCSQVLSAFATLSVNPTSVNLVLGGTPATANITVTAKDLSGSSDTFTVSVGDSTVAKVTTQLSSSFVIDAVGAGATSVTVTSGSGKNASIDVFVSTTNGGTTGGTPPTSPTLVAPSSDATAVSTTPSFSWNASTGTGVAYSVFVDTVSPPQVQAASGLTTTGYTLSSALAGNTLYYWSVVAVNASGSAPSPVQSFTTAATTGVAAPSAPVLTAPANLATGISLSPTLSWNASSGSGVTYDVYLDTNPNPATKLLSSYTGTSISPSVVANMTYYWKVVALNGGGQTSSAVWSFTTLSQTTTVAAPTAPTLVAPASGATAVSTTPTLSWNASTGTGVSYTVYLDTANPPVTQAASGYTGTSVTVSTSPSTTYYWMVTATNSGGSNQSAVQSFTTAASSSTTAAPSAPVLMSPSDGATGVSLLPSLSWNASTGSGVTYDVYADTVNPPAQRQASGLTSTSWTPTNSAPANTTIYWKVVANNAGGSASSAVWSFTTMAVAPAAPAIISPANSATGLGASVSLVWSSSIGASSYNVLIGGTPATLASYGSTSSTSMTYTASPGATYYWQVVASNASGTAASPVYSFSTALIAPGAPSLVSPLSMATGVSTSATLQWNASTGSGVTYNVYVDTVNPPSSLAAQGISATTWAINLVGGTSYYWKVVAMNAAGSASSTVQEFTTAAATVTAPSAPYLMSPGGGSTGMSTLPTLYWSAGTGSGVTYNVYVDTASSPISLVASGVTGTSYTLTMPLSSGTTYYWMVVAINSGGSAQSAIWSFATSASAPSAPLLISPATATTGVSSTPTLAWSTTTDSTVTYSIYLDTNATPATLYASNLPYYMGSFMPSVPLNSGTQYYWTVVATNAGGTASSTVNTFTTASQGLGVITVK